MICYECHTDRPCIICYSEQVVRNLSWIDDSQWYEYDDNVIFFGPAAEADSFPSPQNYTFTADTGRIVHQMSTDNQIHCEYLTTMGGVFTFNNEFFLYKVVFIIT